MSTYYYGASRSSYLAHHGIKGQRWGIRRYQNADGSLTEAGLKRRHKLEAKQAKLDAKVSTAQKKALIAKAKSEKASYDSKTSSSKTKKTRAEKKLEKAQEKKKLAEANRKNLNQLTDFAKSETGKKVIGALLEAYGSQYISSLTDADNSSFLYNLAKKYSPNAKTQKESDSEKSKKETEKRNSDAKSDAEYARNKYTKEEYTWKSDNEAYKKSGNGQGKSSEEVFKEFMSSNPDRAQELYDEIKKESSGS